jgi:hypothetical protein
MTTRRPSALKWLMETRARLAGDAERLRELLKALADEEAKVQKKLAEVDAVLKQFDGTLAPEVIPALRGWKGRYGKRGALRETVLSVLREAYPNALTSFEVATHVTFRLSLDFKCRSEAEHWQDSKLRKVLQQAVAVGEVEALPSERRGTNRWRLIPTDSALPR